MLAAAHAHERGVAAAVLRLEPGDCDPSLLVARLRRSFLRSGLTDAAAALSVGSAPQGAVDALLDHLATTADPILVVLDEVHHAGAADEILLQLLRDLPPPHQAVVAGRALPDRLASLHGDHGVVVVERPELAFTAGEAAALIELMGGVRPSDETARGLTLATGGWPAALALAARHAPDGESALAVDGTTPEPLRDLLDEMLAHADAETVAALEQLAHLPPLTSREVGEVMNTAELVPRSAAIGLPLEQQTDGRLDFSGPVRELLAARAPLDVAVARRAAATLRRAEDTQAAVRLLVAAGEPDDAAAALAELSPRPRRWIRLRRASGARCPGRTGGGSPPASPPPSRARL